MHGTYRTKSHHALRSFGQTSVPSTETLEAPPVIHQMQRRRLHVPRPPTGNDKWPVTRTRFRPRRTVASADIQL